MQRYTKHSQYSNRDGEVIQREPAEVVDADFVEKYASPKTLDFFRELGGTEKVTRSGGTITVRSTNPDNTISRLTVFVPIKES